jgi:hypothetical protein
MNRNNIVFKVVIISVIFIHFTLVGLTQSYDLGLPFLQRNNVKKINENYIYPYFEQNWGMFAPTPPHGSEYIIIQFYSKKIISNPIDIHEKIKKSSFGSPFSLNQRIIKYFSECYNDIIEKKAKGYSNTELEIKSHGLKALLNYSKIVLKNQTEFLTQLKSKDTIKVNIYLINEPLSDIKSLKSKKEKYYIQLKDINLIIKK